MMIDLVTEFNVEQRKTMFRPGLNIALQKIIQIGL